MRLIPFAAIVVLCSIAGKATADEEFIRGDGNTDGILDCADAIYALEHMFRSGPALCRDALDANDDGKLDIADGIYVLTHLFGPGGTPPPDPFPWCGEDDTDDGVGCETNLTCGLGGPIAGLTTDELLAFNRGREVMKRRFKPSEGLGPLYNATSCASCHLTPTVGGSSPNYRNFLFVAVGEIGDQIPMSGLPSIVLPSYVTPFTEPRPTIQESRSGTPVTLAQRNTPSMFGVGLFEFVSNATIIANADPNDTITPDGISGRFNTDGLGHLGRIGSKSQANFIEPFVRGALNNQMGITSGPVDGSDGAVSLSMRKQVSAPLEDLVTDTDGIPDPEISFEDLSDLIIFSRFLRPPTPKPFGADELDGEQLFSDIGCALCHIPTLESAVGDLTAYTDLLLHEMGPDLSDDIVLAGPPQFSSISSFYTESEFRTQPLWGVSLHGPFLHDGRADTLMDAILMHGGEAESVKTAFETLSTIDQEKIIKFLEAL